MAVTPRTALGLRQFRPVGRGSAVALVAPGSPFKREEFDAGVAELARLGLHAIFDDAIFDRHAVVAGPPEARAAMLARAWARDDVDAVIAVRGGYGSVELLPLIQAAQALRRPVAFVGYSDMTSLHLWLNGHVGMTSVHGAMIEGRLACGPSAYDEASFLGSLRPEPLGELTPPGLDVLRAGEATGPLIGGTLTPIAASLGTPYAFAPPDGAVIFLEDVGERPYRLRRLLTQLRLSGSLARASAIVFGPMLRCDEPGGRVLARDVVAECVADFPGPILYGFPSGHTATPMVSLPFGVRARVVAAGTPRLVIEESAAG
jgi:muramoyltetrapeptide carboxypeptidase